MDNSLNSINFGKEVPTRKVIALASDRFLYDGHFNDNVRLINSIMDKDHKISIRTRGPIGCAYSFRAAAKAIRKRFPQIEPVIESLEKITEIKDKNIYKQKYNSLMDQADTSIGKTLDIPTDEIQAAVLPDMRLGRK